MQSIANPFFTETVELLQAIASRSNLLRTHIDKVQTDISGLREMSPTEQTGTVFESKLLDSWQKMQRLILIDQAGLGNDAAAINYLYESLGPDTERLPVADEMQQSLARQFLNAPAPCDNPKILHIIAGPGRQVAEYLMQDCSSRQTPVDCIFVDYEFMTRMIEIADIDGLKLASNYLRDKFAKGRIDKVNYIGAQADTSLAAREDPKKGEALRGWITDGFRARAGTEDKFYTLTRIPTPADAAKDGMDYGKYVELFFQLCDQPWSHLEAAQEILIRKLDSGNTLRVTNDDGTDVTFDISGFTFANSVTAKNIPGSEVFSAPNINGTNGVIVAKGNFTYDGKYMQHITLRFADGIVTEARAEVGDEHLQEILKRPGANRIGEVAFGTNPWLRQHVINGLLVEKIGGSFHAALGASYKYTQYMGVPVKLDNGSVSKVHWDITTMLLGKGGRVSLDGELIQKDGLWTDPALAVLNLGWKALPADEIPPRWQRIFSERAK
jgi:aminopeptidase